MDEDKQNLRDKQQIESSRKAVSLKDIKLNGGFWGERRALVQREVIPYQWKALNDQIPEAVPSYAVEHFRIAAGEMEKGFKGRVYQDSDLAKWLEAACYSLADGHDQELEEHINELIGLMEKAQQPDGYLNTYFTLVEPEKRWSNVRDRHEMYCAGHLIEAAVAHYETTGKRELLDIACRLADHIDALFGPEEGKVRGYPGHQEIELALVKLYKTTGEKKYLELSKFFIEERGRQPHFFDLEAEKRGETEKKHAKIFDYQYSQSHLPIKEQQVATGHSVRAMYFYSAAADIALETGDNELLKAVVRLWEDVTLRQMYITGGVGAEDYGEAFSFDYDLPNDRAYTETCAAIGLVFWARRMLNLELKGEYGDIMEKALYNGVLSGISLDGQKYFYVNPLEVWPEAAEKRYDLRHVKYERQQWFGCACCPPNIARLLASIGEYIFSLDERKAVIHLYTDSTAELNIGGERVVLNQETNYPWDGQVRIKVSTVSSVRFTLGLRLPGWCRKPLLKLNGSYLTPEEVNQNGYALIDRVWRDGDEVELDLSMPVEKMAANPGVREDAGKIALQRGPLVYCLEEEDNGANLRNIVLPPGAELEVEFDPELLGGVVMIKGEALRKTESSWEGRLYQPLDSEKPLKPLEKFLNPLEKPGEPFERIKLKAVPYFAWANRQPGEMLVWISRADCCR